MPMLSDSYRGDDTTPLTGPTRIARYGILGCAGIANKIARAIRLSSNSQIVAVASRDPDKARMFLERNNLADVVALDYAELISHPDVDVVYCPLPTGVRLPWIIKAIGAGKHVLCEKPVGSPKTVEMIITSCYAKNVQFMDGVAFVHHDRFLSLGEALHKKKIIGQIRRLNASMSVHCLDDDNIRNNPTLEPLGVLGDLGIHCVRAALWAFDYEIPQFVKAVCHKRNRAGALQDVSAWLFFPDDRVASLDCSFHNPLRQHMEIVGENGMVEVRQFALPEETRCNYTTHYSALRLYDVSEIVNSTEFRNCCQEVSMVNTMSDMVTSQKINAAWFEVTMLTEQVLDACRRSIDKDGALVELFRGQLWFKQSKNPRRLSVSIGQSEPLL